SAVEEQKQMIESLNHRLRETQEELDFALHSSPVVCGECVHSKGRLEYYLYLYNESERKYDEMEKKWKDGDKECPSCISRSHSKSLHLSWATQITHTRMITDYEDDLVASDTSECDSEESKDSIEKEKKERQEFTTPFDDDEFTLDEPF
ncbi:hypothetical protein PENTCL1PPCAC_11249, partial [Pristionchus entomophagus]